MTSLFQAGVERILPEVDRDEPHLVCGGRQGSDPLALVVLWRGHTWGIGEHVEDVSDSEMERRVATFYEDQG